MPLDHSRIDHREPRMFETAAKAIEYALSEYWVDPVDCTTQEQSFGFDMQVRPVDFAESGKVHYSRI